MIEILCQFQSQRSYNYIAKQQLTSVYIESEIRPSFVWLCRLFQLKNDLNEIVIMNDNRVATALK